MQLQHISKEAGVLRTRLQKGSFNINELNQFLTKVESLSSPPVKTKKITQNERFLQQLENLDKGVSRKPKYFKR